jgi:D-amino peptidase
MRNYYISLDFEGFGGISKASHAFPSKPEDAAGYQMALRDVRCTLEYLFTHTPELAKHHFVINDAHASMTNLFLSGAECPENVSFISGKPKAFGMMAGLNSSYDGVFLLGYHAKAGALNGAIAHTFTDDVADVVFNGVSLGEAGLGILLSRYGYGVPICGTFGDDALGRELEEVFGFTAPKHVNSKKALGWQTIQTNPNAKTELATLMSQACTGTLSVPSPPPPDWCDATKAWQVILQVHSPLVADVISLLPQSHRIDGVRVQLPLHLGAEASISDRIKEVYSVVQCAYSLGLYARFC